MKIKNIAATILVSAATACASVFIYQKYAIGHNDYYYENNGNTPVNYVSYSGASHNSAAQPFNFVRAAEIVTPATVHIKTKTSPRVVSSDQGSGRSNPFADAFGGDDPFSQFFGGSGGGRYYVPGKLASGSGAIISGDGYIVTCNHVIDGADHVIVTLNNKKSFSAKVVGTDPNTDLAVLKIDANHLPYIVFGNSDNVQVGQWVLACGYPLNLQTTVTAGIVSAKSRDLGVNDEGINPVESFIQTDAAINPGNSGGPLTGPDGSLIGITSAIASPTGSFAGYAYAIPVNLVKKVVNDILKYGTVQRAFLGVMIDQPNPNNALKAAFSTDNSDNVEGVKVGGISPDGGAAAAGIQKGDIITKINNDPVNTEADLLGTIAGYHPGDVVKVTYLRDGSSHTTNVTLKNKMGNTRIVKTTILDAMGADFQDIPANIAGKLGISGGVLVARIGSGLIRQQTDMQRNFIIIKAGKYPVKTVDDLRIALEKEGNDVLLQGIYPDYDGTYSYTINGLKERVVN